MEQNTSPVREDDAAQQIATPDAAIEEGGAAAVNASELRAANDAKADAEREGAAKQEPRIIINDRRFWAKDGDADDDATERKPSYVQELEQKLAEKETRLQDTLTQYKEAKDEFEAARARLRRDITREIEAGKRSMLVELLDVVDNLDRAIGAAQAAADGPEATEGALLKGVQMVRDQFLAKLQALGVTRLDAMQQPFNPAHHEAVSLVPVTDATQDGIILGVVRDGYLIGEETLRYGMVAVGKFSEPAQATDAS